MLQNELKIKNLKAEQILTAFDRLTRFKPTEDKYLRVFKELVKNNLLEPKLNKKQIDALEYVQLRDYAQYIINASLEALGYELGDDYIINLRLFDAEKKIFDFNENVKNLLINNINYMAILPLINEKSPINLRWMKELATSMDVLESRRKKKLRFPLEKVVLTEGITEEILLPEFAKICGHDFDENGVAVISAGGKNQVVKYFYEICETLKIPVYILLDGDAVESLEELKPKLRLFDKIHLVKSGGGKCIGNSPNATGEGGEFEDLLPIMLITKTINNLPNNDYKAKNSEFVQELPMAQILENFFKQQGLGEFSKADFARAVRENISCKADVCAEIKTIINEIRAEF